MFLLVCSRAGAAMDNLSQQTAAWWGPNEGLPSSVVTGIVQTDDGFLWLGTLDGLARFDGVKFKNYMPQTFAGMRTARVRLIIPSSSGGVWIVMDKGPILRLDRGTQPRIVSQGIGEIATSAVEDKSGALWIGYQHLATQRLMNGKFTSHPIADAPAGSDSFVAMDTVGKIWIGQGGLVAILRDNHPQTIYKFTNLTMAITGAVDKGMWVYCENRLLKFTEDGQFKDYGSPPIQLAHITSTELFADQNGAVWLGAWRGGLLRFDGRDYEIVAAAANAHAFGALQDMQKNVWIRTQGEGILRLRPAHQQSIAPAAILERVEVDGETQAEYGGLLPPAPGVQDLSVQDASIELPPDHRKVEFDFTSPDFSALENVRFRYKLEGFDQNWMDSQKTRQALYSRLPAGNYSFRIQASEDGVTWREARTSIAMTVFPFYWQKWWFWVAVGAGFALFVAGVRYLSIRRLQRKLRATEQAAALERERSRIAKDLHDDLGGTLTQVSLLLELAQRNPEKAMERVEQMSDTMKQVNESLDEIVWAVNPENDTLPHLINYLGQFAIEFLAAANIRCRVDLPENPPQRPVSPEMRHNLFLMLKEALNNIVRHAQATEVWFRLRVRDDAMEVLIEDNGSGLNGAAAHAGGNGLGNMRHRVEEIGGRFDIESETGAGTRISANLPWPRGILKH